MMPSRIVLSFGSLSLYMRSRVEDVTCWSFVWIHSVFLPCVVLILVLRIVAEFYNRFALFRGCSVRSFAYRFHCSVSLLSWVCFVRFAVVATCLRPVIALNVAEFVACGVLPSYRVCRVEFIVSCFGFCFPQFRCLGFHRVNSLESIVPAVCSLSLRFINWVWVLLIEFWRVVLTN